MRTAAENFKPSSHACIKNISVKYIAGVHMHFIVFLYVFTNK